MTKSDQLRKIIETMVRAEVKRIVPTLVKEAMTQVMGQLIMEATLDVDEPVSPPLASNSSKRRKITEARPIADDDDDYVPSVPKRSRREMAEMLGYGDGMPMNEVANPAGVEVSYAIGASGNPIPIDPASIPEELTEVFSKDYSALMKRLAK